MPKIPKEIIPVKNAQFKTKINKIQKNQVVVTELPKF